ncbi:IucA/IucC family protein [Streptomyces physcomitrii]|uniref:IucA/IucC family protein n=1 Tax=Streptomyces physcomitrii TaxID=2724184 RepID=UPI003F4D43E5
MNATPSSDGTPRKPGREEYGPPGAAVPRQAAGPRPVPAHPAREVPGQAGADLLDHPDARLAAQGAGAENLLRCWVRERHPAEPEGGVLRLPLPATGTALLVPVHYWSACGWHRFGLPRLEGAPAAAPPLDAVALAALLGAEGAEAAPAEQGRVPGQGAGRRPALPSPDATDLVARVADSVRRTAGFLAGRRARPGDQPDLFLAAEQSLVLGHPLHPAPKSREGFSEAEGERYAPELRGSFPLHWIAAHHSVLRADSAWTERGRAVPAETLAARLGGRDLVLPEGFAALPAHPWQIRELRHREDVGALFSAGLLLDLGAHGDPWSPTSSVRTVYRTGAPAMLKLSLGVRITNSRRENLRKELHRGVEVHRLLRGGLAARWRQRHPGFDIVRDPAWLGIDGPDGTPLTGLDVMIRHNPFGPGDDVACVAGFLAPRPVGDGTGPLRSRLAETVGRLAARTGAPLHAVSAEWFLRYLEQVVRPVLWLDGEAGIALEAHQQNTLLLLDPEGWPAGGRYRDNQGYYFRESRRAELSALLPGVGEAGDTFVADAVTDERFAYYLGINNVLGLIGAFGSQGLAEEELLLAAFRRFLTEAAGSGRSALPAQLLEAPVLRCKANLLTRLRGLDELVGPVDTQSVYVTLANPLLP